ncbi:unnamed protein product [Blepharisma stoltei]|uniref:Uncharacterized protein n=1 Tax=Blepharisma stoltei TaxID=1481888 RepID=A0AAU9K0N5_9CILI|nr:unnamed protein product [Blepharisma stoltei]
MSTPLRSYASYLSKLQDTRKQIRPILQSRRRAEFRQKAGNGSATPSSKDIILEQYVKFHSTFTGINKSNSSSDLGLQRLTHRAKSQTVTEKSDPDSNYPLTEIENEESKSVFEVRIANSLEKIEADLAAFKKEASVLTEKNPNRIQIEILSWTQYEIFEKFSVEPYFCNKNITSYYAEEKLRFRTEEHYAKAESKIMVQKVMNFVEEDWDISKEKEIRYMTTPLMRIDESFFQEEDLEYPKELDSSQIGMNNSQMEGYNSQIEMDDSQIEMDNSQIENLQLGMENSLLGMNNSHAELWIDEYVEFGLFYKPIVNILESRIRPSIAMRNKEIKVETKEYWIFEGKPIIQPVLDIKPMSCPPIPKSDKKQIFTREISTEISEKNIKILTSQALQTEPISIYPDHQNLLSTIEVQSDLSQFFSAVTPVPGLLPSQNRYSPFLDSSYSIDFHDEPPIIEKSQNSEAPLTPQSEFSNTSSQVSFSDPIFDKDEEEIKIKITPKTPVLRPTDKEFSSIKIQALVRGWLTRRRIAASFRYLLEYQREIRLRNALLAIRFSWNGHKILRALKKWNSKIKAEKEKLRQSFVNYSAIFIQRNWKGYKIRAKFGEILRKRKSSINKIKSLVLGWKTREILKLKMIKNHKTGIHDALALQKDLLSSKENNLLLSQISNQLPTLRHRFMQDFKSLFWTGEWVGMKRTQINSTLTSPRSFHDSLVNLTPKRESYRNSPFLSPNNKNYDDIPIRARNYDEMPLKVKNFEDLPIKPMQNTFMEALEEIPVQQAKAPQKKFSNFLKRGTRNSYAPKPNKSSESNTEEQTINEDKVVGEEKTARNEEKIAKVDEKTARNEEKTARTEEKVSRNEEKTPKIGDKTPKKSFAARSEEKTPRFELKLDIKKSEENEQQKEICEPKQHPLNEPSQQEEKRQEEARAKTFLKRKSQSIKPQKLEWKVERKIDCWVSKDVLIKKKTPQSRNLGRKSIEDRRLLTLEELEDIFNDMIQTSTDTLAFLKKPERCLVKTRIPQIRYYSMFVTHYKEDNYQELLDALQQHYSYLCNDQFEV